jgi:hypothetical protein
MRRFAMPRRVRETADHAVNDLQCLGALAPVAMLTGAHGTEILALATGGTLDRAAMTAALMDRVAFDGIHEVILAYEAVVTWNGSGRLTVKMGPGGAIGRGHLVIQAEDATGLRLWVGDLVRRAPRDVSVTWPTEIAIVQEESTGLCRFWEMIAQTVQQN